MDAAALGGWTARGTAKVLKDRLQGLSADQRPPWMDGMTSQKLEELLTKVIVDAVEASQIVQEYMDTERAKGRDFEEIYSDVKPYLDRVSRPIEEDLKEGTLHAAEDLIGMAELELENKAARVEKEHARAPHRNLAASFSASFPGSLGSKMPPRGVQGAASRGKKGATADDARTSTDVSSSGKARPPPDTLRSMDFGEQLVLVGACNGWRVDEAKRLHKFMPVESGDEAVHMSVCRVKVPYTGLRFLIVSAEKEWQWRLFPSGKGTLHRSEDRAVAAGLAMGPDADEKAGGKDFKIKGKAAKGSICYMDVTVSLDQERGVRLWLTEVEGEKALPVTFDGME